MAIVWMTACGRVPKFARMNNEGPLCARKQPPIKFGP